MGKLGQETAFPIIEYINNGDYGNFYRTIPGMSKRFYAACAAMQGLLAGDHKNLQCDVSGDSAYPMNKRYKYNFQKIAKKSFELADELLKQEKL